VVVVKAFDPNDASIPVIFFYSYIKPVADACTVDAMPYTKVKDGLWGVHQDLTHDVSERGIGADWHGVCVYVLSKEGSKAHGLTPFVFIRGRISSRFRRSQR
jgi:hypothetical protein